MRRGRRSIKPRPVFVPTVPEGATWFESDRYDRRAWGSLGLGSAAIRDLVSAGDKLVPRFGALLEDLFVGLFKYNLVWQKPDEVRRSAILNRRILEQLAPSPAFEMLKDRTLLEEDKAIVAALVLGEQVLEMIRSEKVINRGEMLDLWDLAHQEEELAERAAALKNAEELAEQAKADPEADPAARRPLEQKIEELKEAAGRAAKVSEARLNQKARMFENQLRHNDQTELKRLQLRTAQLAEEIDRVVQDSHDFSLEFGQGGRLSADERLELGRRLARNKRLGELARLVGRFKQDARAPPPDARSRCRRGLRYRARQRTRPSDSRGAGSPAPPGTARRFSPPFARNSDPPVPPPRRGTEGQRTDGRVYRRQFFDAG